MKSAFSSFAVATLLLLAGPVLAQEPSSKTVRDLSRTVTVTAEVQSVDLPSRTVVLKRDQGPPVTVKVGESARNLPQLRAGDWVSVRYVESLVVRLHKVGGAESGAAAVQSISRAPLGEKPGGSAASQVSVIVPVVGLDVSKSTVTLRGVDGNLVQHVVQDPSLLEGVNVGDNVELTYSEAVTISVNATAPTTEELNRSELGRIKRSE